MVVSGQFNCTKDTGSMPFLLSVLLSFQGYSHLLGVGSFSTLFIGFDKKVIVIDLLTLKQTEVWSQRAGEVLFDMEIEREGERQSVLLLLQWKMLCKRPKYTIMSGSTAEGFAYAGERDVEYLDASHVSEMMIVNNDDIEYFGMDAISDQMIYTVRILWEQNEQQMLKRVFIFVKDNKAFSNSVTSITDSTFLMQFDENWIVTIKGYADINIINKKTGDRASIRITDPDDPDSLISIVNCFMCQNQKLYCRTIEDKLIQVNAETGILEKTFDFMPGIIVSGCDFTGSKVSENMKRILIEHGAVFQ